MTDDLIAQMGRRPAVPKLPNLRRPPAPAPEPRSAPEPATPPQPVPEPRPARSRGTRKAGRPATGRASKGIGLPVALVEPMATAAATVRQSYGDYLMAALNRVWDQLDKAYPPLPKVRPELPAPRRTPRGQIPGGRQAVNFRLTPEQLAALDKRQAQLAVESRSEFVSTIVELDLQN